MENNFSNIKERILQIADYYGISKEKFFEELAISYGNFKGSAKERPINSSFLENLLTKYPDISPDWVLLGKGEMLRKSTENTSDRICDDAKENYTGPNQSRYDDEIIRGLISSIQSLTHSIDKLTDKLCNS